jgi:hypothetical protein
MTDEETLEWLEAEAEAACRQMYDATHPSDAAARYSDTKEALYDAICLAERIGRKEDAMRLTGRLEHVKAVFRSQFR